MCHHEAAVKCNEKTGEKQENENEAVEVVANKLNNKKIALLEEQNNNFLGRKTQSYDDSFRFKREKLTASKINKSKRPVSKNVIKPTKSKKSERKQKLKSKKLSSSPFVSKKNRKNLTSKKLGFSPNDVSVKLDKEVKEAIKSVKLEHNDNIHNCQNGVLCKSSQLRKEEIIRLPTKQADPEGNVSDPKLDVTKPAIKAIEEDQSVARLSDRLNVKSPEPSLLIPQNLVDDTGKLGEDTLIQNPIKSDSDNIQNRSTQNASISFSSEPAKNSTIPRIDDAEADENADAEADEKSWFRTKPLDKLPFSRVVAAQKKNPGKFSPYISFPDLLANLTKSSRSVRYSLDFN